MRSSGAIGWSAEFEAAANEGGADSRAGKAAAAVFGAGAGRVTIVTRNPTSARAARPKPTPKTTGRTRERRGLGATPPDTAPAGSLGGGSRGESSGGGGGNRQVGYGFCPANRTRPSHFVCAATCASLLAQVRGGLLTKHQYSRVFNQAVILITASPAAPIS
jgi:hypothetical protein